MAVTATCGDGVASGYVGVAGPSGVRVARWTEYRAVVVAMLVCQQLAPCAWGVGFGMGQPVVGVVRHSSVDGRGCTVGRCGVDADERRGPAGGISRCGATRHRGLAGLLRPPDRRRRRGAGGLRATRRAPTRPPTTRPGSPDRSSPRPAPTTRSPRATAPARRPSRSLPRRPADAPWPRGRGCYDGPVVPPAGGLMILPCTDLVLTLPYRSHQRSTGGSQDHRNRQSHRSEALIRGGAPGDRTQNPRIKSPIHDVSPRFNSCYLVSFPHVNAESLCHQLPACSGRVARSRAHLEHHTGPLCSILGPPADPTGPENLRIGDPLTQDDRHREHPRRPTLLRPTRGGSGRPDVGRPGPEPRPERPKRRGHPGQQRRPYSGTGSGCGRSSYSPSA